MKTLKLFLCGLLIFVAFIRPVHANPWIEVQNGEWKLDQKILQDIKKKIKPYVLKQATSEHPEKDWGRYGFGALKNWEGYTFQYQGQDEAFNGRRLIEAGRKFVFINAFCNHIKPEANLSRSLVMMKDGGACNFQLKYDPETKTFYDLIFNGNA